MCLLLSHCFQIFWELNFPFSLLLSPFTISYLRNGDNVRTTAQGVRSPEVKGKKAGCPVIAPEVVDQPDLHNETLS